MVRPLRLEFHGVLYHVTALNDEDRYRFVGVLKRVNARFYLPLHTSSQMDNHVHLVVETPEANLAKARRQLNGVYTQAFTRCHNRVGHVLPRGSTGSR